MSSEVFNEIFSGADRKPNKITVKVECQESGEVVKAVDCGTDQAKADKMESALTAKTDLERFFVYQSYEV